MRKLEIRPGVWMAYEDHWFGEPWTVPETVVMVHGNSESSHAWTCWVPHLARKYRVVRPDLPGFGESPEPPGYGWSATELATDIGLLLDALKIETCHLIGAKYGGSACMRLAIDQPRRLSSLCLFGSPVQGSGSGNADMIRAKGVRQWAADTMRSRLGSAASETQMTWWANELMGKTVGARRLRCVGIAHQHGTRERVAAHHGADADRDDAGKRVAIRRGGRTLRATDSKLTRDCAAG